MSLLITAKHVWSKNDQADSVLVENGLIVAVGQKSDLSAHADQIADYPDSIILPGFCDAHLHLAWLGENLTGCDLRGCVSSKDFIETLKHWEQSHKNDPVLCGYGWDERNWSDPMKVCAKLIDQAVLDKPVFLVKIDGHSFAANTPMMGKLGINKDMEDPQGGRFERYEDGTPTGLMFDKASDVYYSQESKQSKEKEFRAAFEHLLSYGITSVRSFGNLDNFIELGRLAQSSEGLPLRVCACIPYQDINWVKGLRLQTNLGSEYFWVGQIKMFADGSLGSSTALVSRPYPDGTYGIEVMTVKEMAEVAKVAHELRLGVAIHTIGDVSAENVARVMKTTNYMDTVEHLQCASQDTIKEIARCETPVVVNPSHIPMDVEAISTQWKEISYMAYPIGSLINAGVPVGFGSDAPVATVNPFHAIACATTRRGQSTKQINPREAISFSTAMNIITEKSAKIIGGPKRGRIESGWLADLAITEDFRGLDPWDCAYTKVQATYVGGVAAWQAQH